MSERLIGYRRVSTQRQGESGLGLEAQDEAIRGYAMRTGGELLETYTEVETGKKDGMDNRPELMRALAHARREKATLVIAKLDRLSRSVYVTAELHRAGVEFVCCDNPTANRLTIQILAVMAEHEARTISERTKAALKAYKDGKRVSKRIREEYANRGETVPQDVIDATAGKLGGQLPQCRNLSPETRRRVVEATARACRRAADEAYRDLMPLARAWRDLGVTLQEIADRLNRSGRTTRRGKPWSHVQVLRLLVREAAST